MIQELREEEQRKKEELEREKDRKIEELKQELLSLKSTIEKQALTPDRTQIDRQWGLTDSRVDLQPKREEVPFQWRQQPEEEVQKREDLFQEIPQNVQFSAPGGADFQRED